MGIDASSLLSGPRGRRICLELAQGRFDVPDPTGPDPASTAVFFAAYHRAREAGDAISLMTLTDGSGDDGGSGSVPEPTTEEVARLLGARTIPDPSAAALLELLGTAVDSARSWQGPDGDDLLAAEPALRTALRRAADVLTRSALTPWWATPTALGDQWQVQFDGGGWERRVDSAAVLAEWSAAQAADEVRWAPHVAGESAVSGSWWSTPPHGLRRSSRALADGAGPVGLRLVEDGLGWRTAQTRRLGVSPSARVYEIDGAAAWAELCGRYPFDVTASRRWDWARATGREGRWLIPDWAQVAADVDGVHVSVAGYLETAGRAVEVGDGWAGLLAGWNPDETVWLNDGVTVPLEDEQTWRTDDDGDWVRA
ncbi:hypothetical protein ACFVU2_13405 [Leifsonia sp. NPDC058194]|uniref:hypothetical protein n=1 Tax=Leifsonia sp. NPDC058194 TaxID=3346374 RepID=UPI0036D8C9F2